MAVWKVSNSPKRGSEGGVAAFVDFVDIKSAQKAHSSVNKMGDRDLRTDYNRQAPFRVLLGDWIFPVSIASRSRGFWVQRRWWRACLWPPPSLHAEKDVMSGDLIGKFQGFCRQVFCIWYGEKQKLRHLGAPDGFKVLGILNVSYFGLETEVISIPVAGILWNRRGYFLQLVGYLLLRYKVVEDFLNGSISFGVTCLLDFYSFSWIMLRLFLGYISSTWWSYLATDFVVVLYGIFLEY